MSRVEMARENENALVVTTFPILTGPHRPSSSHRITSPEDYSFNAISFPVQDPIGKDSIARACACLLKGYTNDSTVGFWLRFQDQTLAIEAVFSDDGQSVAVAEDSKNVNSDVLVVFGAWGGRKDLKRILKDGEKRGLQVCQIFG